MASYDSSGRASRRRQGAPSKQASRGRANAGGRLGSRSGGTVKYDMSTSSKGGFSLRGSSMGYSTRRNSFWGRVLSLDGRAIITLVIMLALLTAIILGIITLVRGCIANNEQNEGTGNPVDPRVAANVSAELTTDIARQLDEGEKIVALAEKADEIGDERLIRLALDETGARDFVLAYPETEHAGQPYGIAINKGEIPTLVCWDTRWGAVDYGDGPLAVTGSGPVALSMAAMGLTGDTSHSPSEVASLARSEGYASGSSGLLPGFITDHASKLGLEAHFYEPSTDNLLSILSRETLVLAEVKEGTITAGSRTDGVHWILILPAEGEGMVRVLDPTSTLATADSWTAQEVAGSANSLYAVSASDGE